MHPRRHRIVELVLTAFCLLPSIVCILGLESRAVGVPTLNAKVQNAFGGQKGAAVVLRVSDGRIVAAHNIPLLTRRVATPGSSIKPFTLQFLLDNKLLTGTERVACRRPLAINGMRLNCSHPDGLGPFDAQDALAFSCNSYFTEVAKRLPADKLEQYLRGLGFDRTTGLLPQEAEGHVSTARTIQQRQLLAIGAAGIQVTPLELAIAYSRLARRKAALTESDRVVLDGLVAAAEYGLAQGAKTVGLSMAGKTGTAADPGTSNTHAWFAGFAPAENPEVVVIVFVEHGRGSVEAATIAHRVFEAWESTTR